MSEQTEQSLPAQSHKSQGLRLWQVMLVSALVSAAAVAGGLYHYHQNYALHVVSFSVAQFMDDQAKFIGTGKATEEALEANVAAMAEMLDGQPANVVVITSDVALHNIQELPQPVGSRAEP